MRKKLIILGIVGGMAILSGWYFFESPKEPELKKAKDFALKNYAGETIGLSDFNNTPVVINFWASWCPYCKEELRQFDSVLNEFNGRVFGLAINRAESAATAEKYSDELGIAHALLLLDSDDSAYRSYGGFSMPETIFIDKNGFVREHRRGPLTNQEFREKIQKLLEQ